MKKLLTLMITLMTAMTLFMVDAEAKRFGGGKSFGKQYSSFSQQKAKPQQTTPGGTQQGSAQAAQGRSSGASRWLGPLAGLAAGGLLASLLFGDGFEGLKMMDILLFAGLIFGGMMLFKVMRGRTSPRPAGAGPFGGAAPYAPPRADMVEAGTQPVPDTAGDYSEAPGWFTAASFTDGAKTHFIRLQAAWDKGDFRDIRDYTTPEMFAELQRERERLGQESHYTEVMMLNAELLGTRREDEQLVASVHFTGMLREEQGGEANEVSEIWHVVHDWDSAAGDWLIAGIQQSAH
jgi:predicted lipid-binding transport protein (Tim44 family)